MSKEKNCVCVQRTAQCKINNECKLNKLKMHIAFEWWKRNVYRWTWAASRQWHSLSTFHLDARFIFPFSFYHLFLYESCEAFMCSGLVTSCEYERKKITTATTTTALKKPSHGIQIYFRASQRWRVTCSMCSLVWPDTPKHMRHTCFLEKSIPNAMQQ